MLNNAQLQLMIAFIERVALHPATCDSLRTEAIMLLGAMHCDDPGRAPRAHAAKRVELRRPNPVAG